MPGLPTIGRNETASFPFAGGDGQGIVCAIGGFNRQVVMAVPAAARQPQAQRIALGGVPFKGEAVAGPGIEYAGAALAQGSGVEFGTARRARTELKRLKPGVSIELEPGFVSEVESIPFVQGEERVCGPQELLGDRSWILQDVFDD